MTDIDIMDYEAFLLEKGLTEKAVVRRIGYLKQAESILKDDINRIVNDDSAMEAALRSLKPHDHHGNMQNALRKFYEMRRGRGFPPLKKCGDSPNNKPTKGGGAASVIPKTKELARALDDLDWMEPGSFKIKKHPQCDWMKMLRHIECNESVSVATWLKEFDSRLRASGYEPRVDYAHEEGIPIQSVCCQVLYQRILNTGDRDAIDNFDKEERQWIQFALTQLAANNPGATFHDLTLRYIDERFDGNKLEARRKAWVDRRTFAALLNGKGRGVSKRIALQLAFAFELTGDEAMDYLASAGIALKPIGEDLVYKVCFEKELYDFEIVNYLLKKRGFGPLVELEELEDPPMDR